MKLAYLMTGYLPSWSDDDELTAIAREEFQRRMQRWPHEAPRPPADRWEPPPAFVQHFYEKLATPLRRLCWAHAICIDHGVESWSEGADAVMRYAEKRGARHLRDDHWHDLEDNIATTILEFITYHDQRCKHPDRPVCLVEYPGDVP